MYGFYLVSHRSTLKPRAIDPENALYTSYLFRKAYLEVPSHSSLLNIARGLISDISDYWAGFSESLRGLFNKDPFTDDIPSTFAWSLSFYPQCFLNYRRRSTQGTTPAFPTINVLGFIAYFISSVALYASPLIRAQYAARNPLSPEPTVRLNDVAYAVHAVVLSILGLTMFSKTIWGFKQGKERVGMSIWGTAVGCIVAVFWVIGLVLVKSKDVGKDPLGWAWLDVVCESEMRGKTSKNWNPLTMECFAGFRSTLLDIVNWWSRL